MSSIGSITYWIGRVKKGEQAAVQKLWEGYFERLVGLARKKLPRALSVAADAEDVALSTFDSFFRRAEQGRFPQLFDRDDLWRLLMVIATRKASHLLDKEQNPKHGGGKVLQASALPAGGDSGIPPALLHALSREPDPEFAAQLAEECEVLLNKLGDTELRRIAQSKMEGYTNEEIAGQIGRALGTIERKLRLIRQLLE